VGGANLKQGYTSQGTEVAGLVGGVTFSKASLDLRRYLPIGGRRKKLGEKKRALAVRLMGGYSIGQVPFFEQYFVGGADTLRGYREARFWGTNMLLGSVELRQPIANALTGVIFVDAGDAWGGSFDSVAIQNYIQANGFTMHIGVGVGIRVRTPLGPLRLDYGIGSEGGQVHFSVGNAF
jgi:outer membrane protein insertion porin family